MGKLDPCINCGNEGQHLHHVVPKSLGGNEGSNLVPLCEVCHGRVHNRAFIDHKALTKAGLQAAKDRGVKLGGLRAGAAQRNKGAKVAAESFAKGFLFVKEMQEAGSTLREIATFLNENNYKARQGGTWGPSSVKYLLDRLENAGK